MKTPIRFLSVLFASAALGQAGESSAVTADGAAVIAAAESLAAAAMHGDAQGFLERMPADTRGALSSLASEAAAKVDAETWEAAVRLLRDFGEMVDAQSELLYGFYQEGREKRGVPDFDNPVLHAMFEGVSPETISAFGKALAGLAGGLSRDELLAGRLDALFADETFRDWFVRGWTASVRKWGLKEPEYAFASQPDADTVLINDLANGDTETWIRFNGGWFPKNLAEGIEAWADEQRLALAETELSDEERGNVRKVCRQVRALIPGMRAAKTREEFGMYCFPIVMMVRSMGVDAQFD